MQQVHVTFPIVLFQINFFLFLSFYSSAWFLVLVLAFSFSFSQVISLIFEKVHFGLDFDLQFQITDFKLKPEREITVTFFLLILNTIKITYKSCNLKIKNLFYWQSLDTTNRKFQDLDDVFLSNVLDSILKVGIMLILFSSTFHPLRIEKELKTYNPCKNTNRYFLSTFYECKFSSSHSFIYRWQHPPNLIHFLPKIFCEID